MAYTFPNGNATIQYAGMVVRLTGSSVFLAQANNVANATDIIGARVDDVAIGGSGYVKPLMAGALIRMTAEPAIGNSLYLSATTAGIGTTVASSWKLGTCVYKVQTGGIWYAAIVPVLEDFANQINETYCATTTGSSVYNSYANIPFGTIVVSSNPNVMDISGGGVSVKKPGIYQFTATGTIYLLGPMVITDLIQGLWAARFFKNGLTQLGVPVGGSYGDILFDEFGSLVRNQTLVTATTVATLAVTSSELVDFQMVSDAAEGAPVPGYFVGTLVATRLKGL